MPLVKLLTVNWAIFCATLKKLGHQHKTGRALASVFSFYVV
jgi:hypothetical protein